MRRRINPLSVCVDDNAEQIAAAPRVVQSALGLQNGGRDLRAPCTSNLREDLIAVALPNASGMASASPAVILLSRRCSHALRRSSSIPAIHTNNITAHHATPLSAVTTVGLKTKA